MAHPIVFFHVKEMISVREYGQVCISIIILQCLHIIHHANLSPTETFGDSKLPILWVSRFFKQFNES